MPAPQPAYGDPARAKRWSGVPAAEFPDGDSGLDEAAAIAVAAAEEYAHRRVGRSVDPDEGDEVPASLQTAVELAAANLLAGLMLKGALAHLPADALGPVLREGVADAFATPAVAALLAAAESAVPTKPGRGGVIGARVIGGPSSLPLTHLDDEAES